MQPLDGHARRQAPAEEEARLRVRAVGAVELRWPRSARRAAGAGPAGGGDLVAVEPVQGRHVAAQVAADQHDAPPLGQGASRRCSRPSTSNRVASSASDAPSSEVVAGQEPRHRRGQGGADGLGRPSRRPGPRGAARPNGSAPSAGAARPARSGRSPRRRRRRRGAQPPQRRQEGLVEDRLPAEGVAEGHVDGPEVRRSGRRRPGDASPCNRPCRSRSSGKFGKNVIASGTM